MESISRNIIIGFNKEKFLQIQNFVKNNGIFHIDNIKQIKNGRNSQVYFIEQGNNKWIVKKYRQKNNDMRNRIKTEFDFLTYLTDNEIGQVAEPIASDKNENLGLFSYLPGLIPKIISGELVYKASEFIRKINETKFKKLAKHLPEASEACFSIISHLNCVKKRVNRLNNILPDSPIQYEVSDFVKSNLITSLEKIAKNIFEKYSSEKLQQSLQYKSRIISPSDFGFQNMLINNKTLNFLDFEYAGWDDPAKLICDFGCHPEIPVNEEYLQVFKNSFLTWLEDAEDSIQRSETLMPLYRLKWCCIMLNEFNTLGQSKEHNARDSDLKKLRIQFNKVKKYFYKHIN